jgi:DNA-directed RNA polymerase specialized sigma24 family protein
MKSEEKILVEYEGLIRATVSRVVKNFNKRRHIDDYDDFLSVARMAAWRAITTYQSDKKAKLSTYIVRCITNNLIQLDRHANKVSSPDLDFVDDEFQIELRAGHTDVRYTAQSKLLTSDEETVLRKIVSGKPLPMIVREKSFSEHVTRRRASEEVGKCLDRIRQKLTFKEVSQLILT